MTGTEVLLLAIGTEGMRYLWVLSQLDWRSPSLGAGVLALAVAVAVLRRIHRRASPTLRLGSGGVRG